jgi:Fe-S cluster biogenesis protein NfuA
MEPANYPFTIYSESTPNPSSMKFVSNKVLWKGEPLEFFKAEECATVPLAKQLFQFPFVKSLFISGNFITVSKTENIEWAEIANELRDFIQSFLRTGEPFILQNEQILPTPKISQIDTDNQYENGKNHEDPEMAEKISEILDQYIRPGVESDGGAINFKSFEGGIVTVTLRGACSGCPSSTITLKAGIESVLKRLIPDVKEVRAEEL